VSGIDGPVDVDAMVADARAAIESADTLDAIRQVGASMSGKKSALAEASRALGSMDPDARKELGRRLHEARTTVEELLESRRTEIRYTELADLTAELPQIVRGLTAGIGK